MVYPDSSIVYILPYLRQNLFYIHIVSEKIENKLKVFFKFVFPKHKNIVLHKHVGIIYIRNLILIK